MINTDDIKVEYPKFTQEMKKTHTILIPSMLDIHFALFENALNSCGYKTEILKNKGPECAALFPKDKAILLAIGITFGITLGLFFVWIFQVILYTYFKFNVVIL